MSTGEQQVETEPKPPKYKHMAIRVTADIHRRAKIAAAEAGGTMGDWVGRLVRAELDRR